MNIDLYKLTPEAATTILRTTFKASPTVAGETVKELVARASLADLGGWAEFLTEDNLKELFKAAAAGTANTSSAADLIREPESKPATTTKARTGGVPKATTKKPAAKKAAAKATAKKGPAKAKAANTNGKAPPHLEKVTGAMKPGDYYQKSDIIAKTGLSQAQFAATIGYMKEHKLVGMVGERGNARYIRPTAG